MIRQFNLFQAKAVTITALAFAVLSLTSCGGRRQEEPDLSVKGQSCSSIEKNSSQEEVVYLGKAGQKRLSYSDIRSGILSSCNSCHLFPANEGHFTFIDSYKGEMRSLQGKDQFVAGYFEVAEKAIEYLNHPDEKKRMPPIDTRKHNPESFLELAKRIDAWVKAGKPQSGFALNQQGPAIDPNRQPKIKRNELGDCIPKAQVIGFDYSKDREFKNATRLPQDLADTDLFSLDAYELAQKGTIAYNVAYPLWADNADKGRWVHFPMKIENGKLVRQAARYDAEKQEFDIPENTRFYKTFYKKIIMPNGKPRFKRIETRLILVRKPWEKSLYGTYKWDDYEQSATLIEMPYRDGTPFKDTMFEVTVDEIKQKTRMYAIPGRQRCIECHMGSPNTGILGFTPLQLNHRPVGEGGREKPVLPSELSQVERFINYGLVQDTPPPTEWPKLEKMGSSPPINEYELRAQGYMVGNCAHCHNPSGLAFTKENGITLDLRPGSIFSFSTHTRSTQIPSRPIVHHEGDLDQSHIWRKVSDSGQQLGMTSQMPMNTPGSPDCQVLRVMGKWVRSFESLQAADQWEPSCKKEPELNWIDQDFTVASSATFIPRRADWDNPQSGMPEKFRKLVLTPALEAAITKEIPVGYWTKKEECKFPDKTLPADEIKPWMMRGNQPKRPFGEIYSTTPGSWYFRTSCQKCHGQRADGNSALARGILNWSGGSVRVANLIGGMFGNQNANLKTFDKNGENFASQYLIWMAMEGTRVQFPPELSSHLGKHGGQMLNQMREKCIAQISPRKSSSPNFMDHEIFRQVCFVDNRPAGDPALAYDPNTGEPYNKAAVEEWADRGAYNVGFAIYEFLREAASGHWKPGNDQCEIVHPNPDATNGNRPMQQQGAVQ